jgi:hypothetical protein
VDGLKLKGRSRLAGGPAVFPLYFYFTGLGETEWTGFWDLFWGGSGLVCLGWDAGADGGGLTGILGATRNAMGG